MSCSYHSLAATGLQVSQSESGPEGQPWPKGSLLQYPTTRRSTPRGPNELNRGREEITSNINIPHLHTRDTCTRSIHTITNKNIIDKITHYTLWLHIFINFHNTSSSTFSQKSILRTRLQNWFGLNLMVFCLIGSHLISRLALRQSQSMIPSLHSLLFPVVYPKVPDLAHSFLLSIQLSARWSQKNLSNSYHLYADDTQLYTSLPLLQILLYVLKHLTTTFTDRHSFLDELEQIAPQFI